SPQEIKPAWMDPQILRKVTPSPAERRFQQNYQRVIEKSDFIRKQIEQEKIKRDLEDYRRRELQKIEFEINSKRLELERRVNQLNYEHSKLSADLDSLKKESSIKDLQIQLENERNEVRKLKNIAENMLKELHNYKRQHAEDLSKIKSATEMEEKISQLVKENEE